MDVLNRLGRANQNCGHMFCNVFNPSLVAFDLITTQSVREWMVPVPHIPNSPMQSPVMKTRARVDLSERWRSIAFSFYVAILLGLMLKPLVAQLDDQGSWRRTNRGWECAHAVQKSFSTKTVPPPKENASLRTSSIGRLHVHVLPVAVACFFLTFGCWLLIGVPNHGIVKHLS